MGRWFRIDDDVIHDLKVQGLPDALFKAWINILCIASKNGGRLPSLDAVAFALRVDAAKATELLVRLVKAGLVDRDEDGHAPHNWDGRQFVKDNETSTERSKKHRAKIKKERDEAVARNNDATLQQQPHPVAPIVAATVAATPPEAEAETDADADKGKGSREVALVPSRWPTDWFDQFWKKYPNKVDRAGAMKSLAKVGSKGGIEWSTIMIGLDVYIAKTDDRPWCNPTTWINQARWDWRPPAGGNNGKAKTGGSLIASIDAELARSIEEDDRAARDESPVLCLSLEPVR